MFCDRCKKNNAVTHIKTNINGMIYEQHLCKECAEKEGFENSFENPFSQLFDSFFAEKPAIKRTSVNCPQCNTTFEEILSTGRIGCSKCYEVFEKELMPYISKLQGNVKHIGKVLEYSENPNRKIDEQSELETLKSKLDDAVKNERYEDAAVLRDKINKLKGGQ